MSRWKIAVVVSLSLVIIVGVVSTIAYFEASTYNRLTGANVTTWDAVWVQLRVQSFPKQETEPPIKRRFSVFHPTSE